MFAAYERIEIGDHVMFANGCFVGDADHRFDDPDTPITWQGFTTQGPGRDRRQLLVRRQLRGHQRGHDRRALRDRRQLGRHPRPAAGHDRRRRPGKPIGTIDCLLSRASQRLSGIVTAVTGTYNRFERP